MKNKAPLVCLAGWGFSTAIWESLLPYLSESFDVICLDLSDMTDDLGAWLDGLLSSLPQTFSVLGWSLGGLIAQYMAKRYPNRVQQVLALCSTRYFPEENHWPGIPKDQLADFQTLSQENMADLLKQFSRWQVSLRDRSAIEVINKALLRDHHAALQHGLNHLCSLDMREEKTRHHFLLANHDALLPASLAETLVDDVRVVSGTHALLVSHPEVVASWVSEVWHG